MSFKGTGGEKPATIEGMIVRDADRLGRDRRDRHRARFRLRRGAMPGRMHDPDVSPRGEMTEAEYRASTSTTVNHFYEKLFQLKHLMNTRAGREIAEARDQFMRAYLDEFFAEWAGKA